MQHQIVNVIRQCEKLAASQRANINFFKWSVLRDISDVDFLLVANKMRENYSYNFLKIALLMCETPIEECDIVGHFRMAPHNY